MIAEWRIVAYNTKKTDQGALTPGWEGIMAKPVRVRCCRATVILNSRRARTPALIKFQSSSRKGKWNPEFFLVAQKPVRETGFLF